MSVRPLTEYCTLNMGQSPDSKTYNTQGNGLPFYQGNADFGETHPITRVWCSAPVKVAEEGDILISVRAPIGAMNMAVERCCIGRGLAALTPIRNKCSKQFLYYALQSKVDSLIAQGTGSTFKAISKKVLEATCIPAYSTIEQEQIAETIGHVDNTIAAKRKQLALLDQVVKSRFIELFGDPETNPKGWTRQRLDQICENLDSRRVPITSTNRKAGNYPYYGASGIVDYVKDYIFDEDILLISEDGANLVMRSTPIAFSVSGKVWVNNHAHVVRFESKATQKYIEICFALTDISGSITGTAQPKLNQAKLNAMMFCVPPIELQEQFATFVEQTDKSKLAVQKGLQELEILKKSLMQQYFG